jgi:hypothetical protein
MWPGVRSHSTKVLVTILKSSPSRAIGSLRQSGRAFTDSSMRRRASVRSAKTPSSSTAHRDRVVGCAAPSRRREARRPRSSHSSNIFFATVDRSLQFDGKVSPALLVESPERRAPTILLRGRACELLEDVVAWHRRLHREVMSTLRTVGPQVFATKHRDQWPHDPSGTRRRIGSATSKRARPSRPTRRPSSSTVLRRGIRGEPNVSAHLGGVAGMQRHRVDATPGS